MAEEMAQRQVEVEKSSSRVAMKVDGSLKSTKPPEVRQHLAGVVNSTAYGHSSLTQLMCSHSGW